MRASIRLCRALPRWGYDSSHLRKFYPYETNKLIMSMPLIAPRLRHLTELVHTAHDSFGVVAAEYYHCSVERVLYVRWNGHIIGEELIRIAKVGLCLHEQFQPLGLVHDTRGTGGDWGDAGTAAWLGYEWIPELKAKSLSLRVITFVIDAGRPVSYDNAQVLSQIDAQFDFRLFYSPKTAWRWLRQRTMAALVTPAIKCQAYSPKA